MNPRHVEFFLNARAAVISIECLEISHASFSKTYRIVRNSTRGLTVTHEDGLEYEYEYYPLKLENLGARDDLDSGFAVNIGDAGGIIAGEVARVLADDSSLEKPCVTYRAYRSDDLSRPMDGPRRLQITAASYKKEGATFEAKAPSLNINRTGEHYRMDRFPSLRGFL